MKKLGLMVLVAGIILMAGCAGDDPAGGGGGTLDNVAGLAIGTASTGRDVALTWTALTSVDGYKVWFRTVSTADWAEVGDVTTNAFTHTDAPSAGYYVVTAYEGTNTSAGNSNEKTTMPTPISTSYTIWDNHAPVADHSGMVFGATSGQTVLAASSSDHDIYCYDGGWTQSPCGFYSGDHTPFGGGHSTDMSEAVSQFAYPTEDWWVTGYIQAGDVIFAELSTGHFVKIYVSSVPQNTVQPLSYGIVFKYDYQPIQGLYLFTTESS